MSRSFSCSSTSKGKGSQNDQSICFFAKRDPDSVSERTVCSGGSCVLHMMSQSQGS